MGQYIRVEAEYEGDLVDAEIYTTDMLDEIADWEIADYIEQQGKTILTNEEYIDLLEHSSVYALPKNHFTKTDLHNHLCDILEIGYYTPKEEILKKLSEMF